MRQTPYDKVRSRLVQAGHTELAVLKPEAVMAAVAVMKDIRAYHGDKKRPNLDGFLRLKLRAFGLATAMTDDEIAALLAAMKGTE